MRSHEIHQLRACLCAGAALAGALRRSGPRPDDARRLRSAPDKAVVVAQADQTPPVGASADQSATQVEELKVYGIRRSQINAQKIKKANENIVEVITAEDIGKLPDESIADSIARLPGLAAQRNNSGRWQDISINGLPPSMSTTLLNGFMQATTDNNRTTQFDQYPAEIMSSVVDTSTKPATPRSPAPAIATFVDLSNHSGVLDYGKTALVVGAQR